MLYIQGATAGSQWKPQPVLHGNKRWSALALRTHTNKLHSTHYLGMRYESYWEEYVTRRGLLGLDTNVIDHPPPPTAPPPTEEPTEPPTEPPTEAPTEPPTEAPTQGVVFISEF